MFTKNTALAAHEFIINFVFARHLGGKTPLRGYKPPRKGRPPVCLAPWRATRQGTLPTGCRVGFSRRTAFGAK